jgi:hypothetical protein
MAGARFTSIKTPAPKWNSDLLMPDNAQQLIFFRSTTFSLLLGAAATIQKIYAFVVRLIIKYDVIS